jgi:hypothetical protein
MARRAALFFLALASPLVLALFLVGGTAAGIGFSVLATAYPAALITVAVARRRGLGPLAWPLAAFLVLQEICVLAICLLRDRVLEVPWVGGLPMAAAFQLYGLWAASLLLVTLTYALTFDRLELSREDIERLES